MHKRTYYIVNGITFYRLMAAPVMGIFIFCREVEIFKWLLAVSFLTDAIDGTLARRYKVNSLFGSRLDSIADDLTITAGVLGMLIFKPLFFKQVLVPLLLLFIIFILQMVLAYRRYGRLTSFHTYGAKVAALLQGVFLILLFFLPQPLYLLFYLALSVTGAELIEEIILTLYLPIWETDVKGLYWVFRRRRKGQWPPQKNGEKEFRGV